MVVPAEVKSEEVIFDANLSALIALLGKYAMENIFCYLDDTGCLIKYYVFSKIWEYILDFGSSVNALEICSVSVRVR